MRALRHSFICGAPSRVSNGNFQVTRAPFFPAPRRGGGQVAVGGVVFARRSRFWLVRRGGAELLPRASRHVAPPLTLGPLLPYISPPLMLQSSRARL